MLNERVNKIFKPYVSRSIEIAGSAAENTRHAADLSADWVKAGKKPVVVVTQGSLKLNNITHDSIAKLVTRQSEMVQGSLAALAKRLKVAAKSDTLRTFWKGQMELMPATRQRLSTDVRKTVEIFSETRDDLRVWAQGTFKDLTKADEPVKKAARRTAKSVSAKTNGAARTVKKTAAKTRKVADKQVKKVTRKTNRATARKS